MLVDVLQIIVSWQIFGLMLDVCDIYVGLKDGGIMVVKCVILVLDVWQSLLYMCWQFCDFIFWQLQVYINIFIQINDGGESLKIDCISDFFLCQFDYFILCDSYLSFLIFFGQWVELVVLQLIWFNGRNCYCVEGQFSFFSFIGQYGVMQVWMDFCDEDGLLNKGWVWLQVDDIDVKLWLGCWMQDNIVLKSVCFSFEGWMIIEKGDVVSGDVWLKKGGVSWQGDNEVYYLLVDNLMVYFFYDK